MKHYKLQRTWYGHPSIDLANSYIKNGLDSIVKDVSTTNSNPANRSYAARIAHNILSASPGFARKGVLVSCAIILGLGSIGYAVARYIDRNEPTTEIEEEFYGYAKEKLGEDLAEQIVSQVNKCDENAYKFVDELSYHNESMRERLTGFVEEYVRNGVISSDEITNIKDSDGDLLVGIEELNLGTDPNVPDPGLAELYNDNPQAMYYKNTSPIVQEQPFSERDYSLASKRLVSGIEMYNSSGLVQPTAEQIDFLAAFEHYYDGECSVADQSVKFIVETIKDNPQLFNEFCVTRSY
jgi:hypothetical protein